MNFEFEVVSLGVITLMAFANFIRLEAKVANHAKEVAEIKAASDVKERAFWEQLNVINECLRTIVQQLGRVEGKIDRSNQ